MGHYASVAARSSRGVSRSYVGSLLLGSQRMALLAHALVLVGYCACFASGFRAKESHAGFPWLSNLFTGTTPAPYVEPIRPNFSGEWHLERSENQKAFLKAVGYSFFIRQAAELSSVRQIIHQSGDNFAIFNAAFPSPVAPRNTSFHLGEEEVPLLDDGGREMVMSRPTWEGDILKADLRYINPPHVLEVRRSLEDGKLVERVRHLAEDVEMRRIFRKVR